MCLGVENGLVSVSGSKLTWILCDDVRPRILSDICVGYVLEDHSVTIRVAQWFILFKRTKEMRASDSSQG